MFCFPTNVEARCWCVVVIIFLHNGSKRVIKGNKSRSREKYVKVRGVRFLRASVFIMRVGRFHARVSTLLVLFWSFLFTPTKTTTRDETRAYLDLLFHLHSNPPIFPPQKKRILCLGCKICKDFFFSLFFFGKMNFVLGGGVCRAQKRKRERHKEKMSPCVEKMSTSESVYVFCVLSQCVLKKTLSSLYRACSLSLSLSYFFTYLPPPSRRVRWIFGGGILCWCSCFCFRCSCL